MMKTDNLSRANRLTSGPIVSSILSLSVPIIVSNLLQTAYQLTDSFWVGRLGSDAVAALSISFPILFLIISLGTGAAIAGTILVARHTGRKDKDAADHVATQTMLLVFFFSIALSAIGYILSPKLLSLIGARGAVFRLALPYLKLSFLGVMPVFVFIVFQALMRGAGNVKLPMLIVFAAVLLNFFLDPIVIFGKLFVPAYGVSGAAIATIATQALASIAGIIVLLSGKYEVKLKLSSLKPDFLLIKKILKLGFPSTVEQTARGLGMSVMAFFVASFGTISLAAYGIGTRVLSFIILPAIGFSMATSVLVGQNLGAGKQERAELIARKSSLVGFVLLSFFGALIFILARKISEAFIPGNTETIEAATQFIRIMAPSFGFVAVQLALTGAFRGSGNTLLSMYVSLISLWLIRLPLAYFLSKFFAETGIWASFPLTNVIAALFVLLLFFTGYWKKKFSFFNGF